MRHNCVDRGSMALLSAVQCKPGRSLSLMEFSLQALLVRHEAYMADAEEERKRMTAHIEHLEGEKQQLEKKNATIIEENRNLLDQLEAVNNAVTDSDAHATSLQATLQSTNLELHRLAQLAAKTERLEQELADYEREHATWQATLDEKDEAERGAVSRWHKAERTLLSLQEQLERIEHEAREDRERHVEVVGRMERRHAVEKELDSAAGKLKGAVVSKTAGRDGGGTNMVSHFVKDILSDNAKLQMGIVELREMLQNSNDEVENLRHQLSDHQPAEDESHKAVSRPDHARRASLRDELNRASSSELHVHHHYHAPAAKPGTVKRPKKKRYGALTPNHFTPPVSGRSTPRSSTSYSTPTSATTILQQTTVSIPQSTSLAKRWSAQSNKTHQSLLSSSGPSSPQSTTNRTSSLFDRAFSDTGHDSSRPTTPDSEEPGSPYFAPTHSKRPSAGSYRTSSAPIIQRRGISPGVARSLLDSIMDMSFDDLPQLDYRANSQDAIPEENEGDWENESSDIDAGDSTVTSPSLYHVPFNLNSSPIYKQPLRRAASHESLLSVRGMDIHTLKGRPSQLLMPHVGSLTSHAVVSGAQAQAHTARPSAMSRPASNIRTLLSGMAADQRAASTNNQTIKKKAAGWILGRWGATPAPSTTASLTGAKAAIASSKPPSRPSTSDKIDDPEATPKKPKPKLRPAGINQHGSIFGFAPEVKVQHAPVMKSLDTEALRKVLDSGQ